MAFVTGRTPEVTISSANSFRDLYDWIEHLQDEHPLDHVICIVKDSLDKAQGDDHRFLGGELAWLLRKAERDKEAIQVLDEMLKRYPDDVRPAITKAELYVYLGRPKDALKCIDVALERAHRTGFFRREALGNKARILLELGRGEELSDVLEEIMSLQIVKGIPDIGRERDFVDRAPPGFIRKSVLDRYDEFRLKRPDDDMSANEPPKFEPPDDAA